MEKQLTAEQMQKLYNYLAETFNCMPLESEMLELIDIVSSLQPTEPATEKEPVTKGEINAILARFFRKAVEVKAQNFTALIEEYGNKIHSLFSPVSQTKEKRLFLSTEAQNDWEEIMEDGWLNEQYAMNNPDNLSSPKWTYKMIEKAVASQTKGLDITEEWVDVFEKYGLHVLRTKQFDNFGEHSKFIGAANQFAQWLEDKYKNPVPLSLIPTSKQETETNKP